MVFVDGFNGGSRDVILSLFNIRENHVNALRHAPRGALCANIKTVNLPDYPRDRSLKDLDQQEVDDLFMGIKSGQETIHSGIKYIDRQILKFLGVSLMFRPIWGNVVSGIMENVSLEG